MPRAPKKTKPPPKTLHIYRLESRQGDPLIVVLEDRAGGHVEMFILPAFDSYQDMIRAVSESYRAAGGEKLIPESPEKLDVDTPDFTPEWFDRWKNTYLAQLGGRHFFVPVNPDPKTLN